MNSWLYIGDFPSPVIFPATVALSPTECLVIGGVDKTGEYISTVYKLVIKIPF